VAFWGGQLYYAQFIQRFLQVKCIREFVMRTAFMNKMTPPNTQSRTYLVKFVTQFIKQIQT